MADTAPPTIGELVRSKRTRSNVTIGHLAATLGVSPSTIYRLEDGRNIPKAGTLARIIRELNMNPAEVEKALGPSSFTDDVLSLAKSAGVVEDFTEYWLARAEDQRPMLPRVDLVGVHENGATVMVQIRNAGSQRKRLEEELTGAMRQLSYIVTVPAPEPRPSRKR